MMSELELLKEELYQLQTQFLAEARECENGEEVGPWALAAHDINSAVVQAGALAVPSREPRRKK